MNPEMAYFIRPCSLPQNPAFPPCKGRELASQAFDIARFLGAEPNFLPALRELGGAAALDAGVGAAVLVEELGELFEHDTAQLLGVDNGDGTAVIAGHVVADADRRQLDLAQALDLADHLPQVLFEVVAGVDRGGGGGDRGA